MGFNEILNLTLHVILTITFFICVSTYNISDPTQRLIMDLRKEIAALKLQLESGGVAPAAAAPASAAPAAPAADAAPADGTVSSPPPPPAAAALADGDSAAAPALAAPAPEGGTAAAPAPAPFEETVTIAVVSDEVKKTFKSKQDRARATAALEAVAKDPVKAAALSKALEASKDGTAQIEAAPGEGDEKGKKKGSGSDPITVNKSCVNVTKSAAAPGLGPERIVIQKEVLPKDAECLLCLCFEVISLVVESSDTILSCLTGLVYSRE